MKSLFAVVAVTFAFAIGLATVDQQPSDLRAQVPDAPVVTAPAELPPTPPLVATIDGPVKSSGTFYVKVETNPLAINTWTKVFPVVDGKMFEPMVWPGRNDGSEMWIFQEPPKGVYYVKLRSQLPNKLGDGVDPIVDLEHATIVGTLIDPPPVVTDPTNPPPVVVDPNVPADEVAKVKEPGFRCLFTYEATRGIPDVFADPKVRSYLFAKTVKGPDGKTPEWRMKDNDEPATGDFPVWKLYRETLPPGTPAANEIPMVSVGNGVRGYAGPAPKTGAELLVLLQKFGGN